MYTIYFMVYDCLIATYKTDIGESINHRPFCINRKGLSAEKLLTEIEYVGRDKMVRKLTFGQRDNSKRNKTILLVGETGTGKTTLVNSLVNYFRGMTKEHWFEMSEEIDGKQCQTQLTIYQVFIEASPISWSIIETPGYGGTQDIIIRERLLTLLESYDETPSIDAIGFVVTSTLNRLDNRQLYILDAAQSLFARDVKKNIVVFITHAGERTHHNVLAAIQKANVPVAKDKNNEAIHFLYDNILSDGENASDDLYKSKWEMGKRSTDCFMTYLDTLETVSLEKTKDVLIHRLKLEQSVIKLDQYVKEIESQQNDLDKINSDFVSENSVVEVQPLTHQPSPYNFFYLLCCGSCRNNENNCDKGESIAMAVINNTDEKDMYGKEYKQEKKQVEADPSKQRKSKLLDEAYDHIIKLEEMALKQSSIFTLVHLDSLIERMKEIDTNNSEKVQRLEELMGGVDENSKRALKYLRYIIQSDRENASDDLCKATEEVSEDPMTLKGEVASQSCL